MDYLSIPRDDVTDFVADSFTPFAPLGGAGIKRTGLNVFAALAAFRPCFFEERSASSVPPIGCVASIPCGAQVRQVNPKTGKRPVGSEIMTRLRALNDAVIGLHVGEFSDGKILMPCLRVTLSFREVRNS